MTAYSIDGKMVEKVYVDWEMNSIIAQLENLAMEKAAARNKSRIERGDSPVKGLEINTLEWHARDLILQLQREIAEMTAKREEKTKEFNELFRLYNELLESEKSESTGPEASDTPKRTSKRRPKTDPSAP